MPRLPPVTRTMPSAAMTVAGQGEQPAGNQLLVGRDDMFGHGANGAVRVGVAAAEIAARAHEHVNDGLELLVAEVINGAGVPRAFQDSDVGSGNSVEMLLVTGWRKK